MDINTVCVIFSMMSEEVSEHVLPGVGSLVVTDPRLLLAARQSHESRAMLPVIKEELRLRIMTQRHAQGKEEIVVDFNNNNVKYEVCLIIWFLCVPKSYKWGKMEIFLVVHLFKKTTKTI